MDHTKMLSQASHAISEVADDENVSKEKRLDELQGLADDIESMMDELRIAIEDEENADAAAEDDDREEEDQKDKE